MTPLLWNTAQPIVFHLSGKHPGTWNPTDSYEHGEDFHRQVRDSGVDLGTEAGGLYETYRLDQELKHLAS